MTTQSALLVTSIGEPLTITTEWPIPRPGPSQVQIRVTVAAINPHDGKARETGLFIQDILPAILANDVAGVVTAIGSDVTQLKVGDRVFTYGSFAPGHVQKGLQQYALADEDFAVRIPEGFSDHDAATLPVNITAGVVGFFDQSGLGIPAPWVDGSEGSSASPAQILIIGGGSNCGRFAVQLAKLAGIKKIVVVGGNEQELKEFGATHVLDRHGGSDIVLQRIRDVVGDELLHCIDTVNPASGQVLGINALSNTKKGKFARLIPQGEPNASHINDKKAGYEIKDVKGAPHWWPESCKPFYARLNQYLAQGKIRPLKYDVIKGLDAGKVNEVFDKYRDGKPVIQTHVRISE